MQILILLHKSVCYNGMKTDHIHLIFVAMYECVINIIP